MYVVYLILNNKLPSNRSKIVLEVNKYDGTNL